MFALLFGLSLFELFGYVALAAVVILLFVWIINRKAFRDLWASGRAQIGKIGSAAVSYDPRAVFEQEVRDARDELNRSIGDLEESNGAVSELRELNKANARKVALLESHVRSSLTDDPEDKSGKAAEYVMQLEAAEKLFASSQEQLTRAEKIYSENLKKYKLASKKIAGKEERGRQLGQEVKSSEMNARLAKLAQKFNVDVGGLESRLSEAEDEMQRKIARNNAVSDVQQDLGINGLAEAEEEERLAKANAKNKLEEYRKKMNLGSN